MANVINIQYGSKSYQLPKSLVTNEEFVKEIVSANVWNNKLRKSDKMNLLKFLPDFPNNDTHEKKETLKKLFLGKHINFENQIKTFVRLAKEGDFNASIKPQKGLDLILSERNRKIALLKRRLNDLQAIIKTKKSLSIRISEEEDNCMRDFQHFLSHDDPLSDIVDSRFDKIMRKISGDSDGIKRSELFNEYFANDSMDFQALSLSDVINRCQNDNDVATEEQPVAIVNGPMTRKRRQLQNGFENSSNKYAKFNDSSDSQSDSSDGCRSNDNDNNNNNNNNSDDSLSSDTDSVGSGGGPVNGASGPPASAATAATGDSQQYKRARLNRHERREFRCPQDDFPDFFCLLQRLFAGAHQQRLTTAQVEERIRHWHIVHQRAIGDTFNRWATLSLDWACLAVPALTFLASDAATSVVEHRRKSHSWRWKIELDQQTLRRLCALWQQRCQSMLLAGGGPVGAGLIGGGPVPSTTVADLSEQIPPALSRTDWRVRPSTAEERARFQLQERRRFLRPWRGFVYNTHGFDCAVAPVRGCLPGGGGGSGGGAGGTGGVKARGHPLLVSERPPHVNIVEIVRDAVARLPNGEGSRADIVALAMDSAFWSGAGAPGAERNISQCISSALDRLQGEGCDPSVKYNARLKLWFYRHRNKRVEELEQLHLQQLHHHSQQHQHDENKRLRAGTSNGHGHSTAVITSSSKHQQQQQHQHQQQQHQQQVVQTYQQFSQAVNHARDLTMQQPIYIARQSANNSNGGGGGLHHQMLFSPNSRLVTSRQDFGPDYYHSSQPHQQQHQQQQQQHFYY